jgi:small-conductance mechanosensitive channel
MPEEPTPEPAPPSLRTALLLLGGETVLLALLTGFLVYADFSADRATVTTAIGTTAFAVLLTGLLGLFTWALFRRRAWARGPAIVLQLLLVPIGVTMFAGGLPTVGIPTILLGLVGAGSLLAPTTREALHRN